MPPPARARASRRRARVTGYGTAQGYLPLWAATTDPAGRIRRGAPPEQIVLTHGATDARHRRATPDKPGDTVFVDDPGYFNFFRQPAPARRQAGGRTTQCRFG